ncbi:hypothetical protein [Streptomyces sp. NPDC002205]|uniref:hypothetical protein n=1 Tax=Streptomyces sp. NPDC002205 TaxID=3154411 RepID=UPI0033317290
MRQTEKQPVSAMAHDTSREILHVPSSLLDSSCPGVLHSVVGEADETHAMKERNTSR